jgi:CBS domain-containing protein
MKVKDIMTKEVQVIHPGDSLEDAARKMGHHGIGFLPILEQDELVGVLTDRDIIVRGIAIGMNSDAALGRDLMTSPCISCFDDQNVREAANLMEQHQVRRLVVLSRDNNRLVGVVSLGDIATNANKEVSAEVLEKVSEPTA